MILLDTNVAIAVLRDRPPEVRRRLRMVLEADEAVAISSVVLFELRHGAARSASPARNHARIDAFLGGRIEVLPLDAQDAAQAGELRAALERQGLPIGAYDLLIAAQARRRQARLVTHNTREFARVEELGIEDWQTE